jgi:hypothetical protein
VRVPTQSEPFRSSVMDRISLSGSPSPLVYRRIVPPLARFRPWGVPIQTEPSRLTCSAAISSDASPSAVVMVWNTPARYCTKPARVPTHRVLSAPAQSLRAHLLPSLAGPLSSNAVNRIPSNRARPSSVPTHMYPSSVCAMAYTLFCGRPFRLVQLFRTYCESCFPGSSDQARSAINRIRTAA